MSNFFSNDKMNCDELFRLNSIQKENLNKIINFKQCDEEFLSTMDLFIEFEKYQMRRLFKWEDSIFKSDHQPNYKQKTPVMHPIDPQINITPATHCLVMGNKQSDLTVSGFQNLGIKKKEFSNPNSIKSLDGPKDTNTAVQLPQKVDNQCAQMSFSDNGFHDLVIKKKEFSSPNSIKSLDGPKDTNTAVQLPQKVVKPKPTKPPIKSAQKICPNICRLNNNCGSTDPKLIQSTNSKANSNKDVCTWNSREVKAKVRPNSNHVTNTKKRVAARSFIWKGTEGQRCIKQTKNSTKSTKDKKKQDTVLNFHPPVNERIWVEHRDLPGAVGYIINWLPGRKPKVSFKAGNVRKWYSEKQLVIVNGNQLKKCLRNEQYRGFRYGIIQIRTKTYRRNNGKPYTYDQYFKYSGDNNNFKQIKKRFQYKFRY